MAACGLVHSMAAYDGGFGSTCNPAKTVCANFPNTDRMKVVAHIFPSITLDGNPLKYVNEVRYLL